MGNIVIVVHSWYIFTARDQWYNIFAANIIHNIHIYIYMYTTSLHMITRVCRMTTSHDHRWIISLLCLIYHIQYFTASDQPLVFNNYLAMRGVSCSDKQNYNIDNLQTLSMQWCSCNSITAGDIFDTFMVNCYIYTILRHPQMLQLTIIGYQCGSIDANSVSNKYLG